MITCPACECRNNDTRIACRRCGKEFPFKPRTLPVEVVYPAARKVIPLAELKRIAVTDALRMYCRRDAARRLGISEGHIGKLMRLYGLDSKVIDGRRVGLKNAVAKNTAGSTPRLSYNCNRAPT